MKQKRMTPNLSPASAAQGVKIARAFSPWLTELRERQGRAFSRITCRKKAEQLTGISHQSIALRSTGDRSFRLTELGQMALSTDPSVNPFEPITDGISLILAARRRLPFMDLLRCAMSRSVEEQRHDGGEDITQIEFHDAMAPVLAKGPERCTPREIARARAAAVHHHAQIRRYHAHAEALMGDLEALIPHLPAERAH